jgi:hypothetical protein
LSPHDGGAVGGFPPALPAPRGDLSRGELRDADLVELLLYALAGDDDPALGAVRNARHQLDAVEALAAACALRPGALVDPATLAPALAGVVRRLDIAIELLERRAR